MQAYVLLMRCVWGLRRFIHTEWNVHPNVVIVKKCHSFCSLIECILDLGVITGFTQISPALQALRWFARSDVCFDPLTLSHSFHPSLCLPVKRHWLALGVFIYSRFYYQRFKGTVGRSVSLLNVCVCHMPRASFFPAAKQNSSGANPTLLTVREYILFCE